MDPAGPDDSPPDSGGSAVNLRPPWLQRAGLWFSCWLAWLTVLTILSSMSQPGPRIDVVGFDKVVHFGFFLFGGVLFTLSLVWCERTARRPLRWGFLLLAVTLTGAAVGWLDEWHQSYTPGRHGLDVFDWLADVLGSLFAAPSTRALLRFSDRWRKTAVSS